MSGRGGISLVSGKYKMGGELERDDEGAPVGGGRGFVAYVVEKSLQCMLCDASSHLQCILCDVGSHLQWSQNHWAASHWRHRH